MDTWSTSRKAAAIVFVCVSYAVLIAAALYLSGALFRILNLNDPSKTRLLSIVGYWQRYADEPAMKKKLQVSTGVAGGGLLVLLPALLVAQVVPRRPLHGDARFANRAEIRRAGLLSGQAPSILVGRYGRRYLSLPGQLSVMLSAPTRSGKGVAVVIPNLLNWPDSVVTLDIKGENYRVTAGFRARFQPVFRFSPCDPLGHTHRWNPLAVVRTDEMHRVADLLSIGQALFPNDPRGGAEAFFSDQARNLFLGLGLLLLETPELPRTIGEMLRQSSGNGRPLTVHLQETIRQRTQEGRPLSYECTDALHRLTSNSGNTLACIVATFNAPLIIFADAIVDAATSGNDFRLEDLRRQRMSVYVNVPPNRLADARPLLNLFFSQLISLNTQLLPEQDPTLKYQCLLINDEFTAMGRVDRIATSAPYLAGYNLRLLTVVQAMSQLDSVYGEKEARTFATNHGLQILYAPREQRDAEEYSAMLGHFTETSTARGRSHSYSSHSASSVSRTESDQRRSLLLPQEFKDLGAERIVLILENCKPVLARKLRYHRDRTLRRRPLPPPAVPRMDMARHRAIVQRGRRVDVADAAEPGDRFGALADGLARGLDAPGHPEDPRAKRLTDFLSQERRLPSDGRTDFRR